MALFVKTGAKYSRPETTFGPELILYYDSIHSDFHHVEYRRYMNFYLDRRVVIKNCLNDQKHRKTRHCFKRHKVRADVITQPFA